MNCKQIEVIVRTSPKALWTSEELKSVQAHASECAQCAAFLEREKHLEDELHALFEPTPSKDILPIVMAQIENLPKRHANAPSRERQLFGSASKAIGVAAALGAYLFSLLMTGEGAHISLWDEELLALTMPDASKLIFAAGLLLYVIGVMIKGDEEMRRGDEVTK